MEMNKRKKKIATTLIFLKTTWEICNNVKNLRKSIWRIYVYTYDDKWKTSIAAEATRTALPLTNTYCYAVSMVLQTYIQYIQHTYEMRFRVRQQFQQWLIGFTFYGYLIIVALLNTAIQLPILRSLALTH